MEKYVSVIFLDIPHQTHSRYVSFIFDDVPIEAQLHKRSVKFLYEIITLYERQFILYRTAKGWFYNGRLKYNAGVFLCD